MLQTLHIKNFALIEHLHIDFSAGLSTITGETGAGKSILLGALGLVLGRRADLTSLKDKGQKCIVEAHFNITQYNLKDFFIENDLDYEDATIIRREILPSGKSRAFVNDSPVNLQELQQLGDFLIDIHSQQQTRELTEEQYQIELLDAIAANNALLAEYKSQLSAYKKLQSEYKALQLQKESLVKEQDYNNYILQELLTANLKAGEQEEMEQQLEVLNNTGAIKEALARAAALASDENVGVLNNLKEIRQSIHKISGMSVEYNELYERLSSLIIEFDDIKDGIEESLETLSEDPEKLELINNKLQVIYQLQKKHSVQTIEELLEIQESLDSKVMLADEIDSQLSKLEKAFAEAELAATKTALALHNKRQKAIPILTDSITAILSQLGMPDARFDFKLAGADTFYGNGKDILELLFAANKGTGFGLLKKVASGGEMSRIMLAVKAVLAQYSNLPTIIFDEIDTGVSGEIANKMAGIMKEMSAKMQVFAITHLPQIAAKGDQHYKVEKTSNAETTVSELKLLTPNERVHEIAQMLSGKDFGDSALNHARALLN
ncbi:DNA repair protein RecN [Flavobacterium sp. J372]|uniref:DNA repair protein RecN n=1 Tax=Flavobacterium sp. J372 TaxID=2898436 RepID=UPI002151309B|nr:DNA repair protein RecN [Flavobacterium sp. J372]MCR5862201.1 DNA repair protein RecN [Flavobacterium sp. J372]